MKQNAGQLRLRGLAGAQGEFTLHALCHNLRKLAKGPRGNKSGGLYCSDQGRCFSNRVDYSLASPNATQPATC